MNRVRTLTGLLLAALAPLAAALAGCGSIDDPVAEITVQRDRLEVGQSVQTFQMESDWARHGLSAGGWNRVLLAFRLPGSRAGAEHPHYAYWLHMKFRAGPGQRRFAVGAGQRAVFVQTSGTEHDRKKREDSKEPMWMPEGLVKTWLAGDGVLTIEQPDKHGNVEGKFSLQLTDGTKLEGEFTAQPGAGDIDLFEQKMLSQVFDEYN